MIRSAFLGLMVLTASSLCVFADGDAASAHAARTSRLPAPYNHVRWTGLNYPGLDCGGAGLMLEDLAEVAVSGLRAPVALAMVGCKVNHVFAHLYAFVSGTDPRHPVLLQRLPLDQGLQQPLGLSTSRNRVTLKAAGYSKKYFQGLCCPTVITIRRWVWDGSHFRTLRPIPITNIVIPNVIGLSLDKADHVLTAHGIAWYDWNQRGKQSTPESRLIVVAINPAPGTLIHPPRFHVAVTTAPRHYR